MKILITGVAGFIGSNYLKHHLKNNPKDLIIGIDKLTYAGNLKNIENESKNNNFIFIKEDICNQNSIQEIIEKYDIEKIINFAAESHVDNSIESPQIFTKTNVLGTQILLDSAKKIWYDSKKNTWKTNTKFIQISTDEVYGSLELNEKPFTENNLIDPHSPYSASKAAADMIVKSYYDTYKMPINITRCSNNFGPNQHEEKLIPKVIKNAINKKPIPVYGDGKQIRDWLYVEDHCKAIEMVLKNAKSGQIYNIGDQTEKTNIELIKTIINYLNKKDSNIDTDLIQYVKDRPGHDKRYAINSNKIKKDLNWQSSKNFDKNLYKTIDSYIKQYNI
ncbi:dTDP-glucose 4,6-dehydratase [Oceanotoga teriensis]|jgi:dTDP-glucose 4,6-dehydratase|uniref:dTDP-glucose 4,6-dehydratase n=2 Tax=Oceanotoga TaxID=1255275 RepID=A0AA45C4F9_9BACT|nr:dTDP-glucose 4,6-dehydratase [Oceanotoga teriensis]MDO7975773.1 dTDP-glucose 4,6-dehydratase [Oceanotoga teriensis]PWJ85147.1 dTDP-glucose 4,6-dehydratase [Oceanotoga teriensis]